MSLPDAQRRACATVPATDTLDPGDMMALDVTTRSAEHERLLALAAETMPGGSLGYFRLPDEVTLVVREGRGSKVYDVDGREYVDYILGSGPMLIGHAHPDVVAAVTAQLARGTTFYLLTEEAIRLAERICALAPCAEQVRFTSTGNEAVSFALRLARAYRERDTILKFEGGFHGVGDYAQYSVTPKGEPNYPYARAESAGVPKVLDQTVLVGHLPRLWPLLRRPSGTGGTAKTSQSPNARSTAFLRVDPGGHRRCVGNHEWR